jgi:deoxyribonuclease V
MTPDGPRRAAIRHRWDVTPARAREIQERLAGRIEKNDRLGEIRFVGGTDLGFEDEGRTARGAVAVLAFQSLELVDWAVARRPVTFPYVPGLLSFREIPALLDAWRKLRLKPDVVLCDGQGVAHPRRIGIASHFGLLADVPAVGVAKSRLVGTHREPGPKRGSATRLMDGDEQIGIVLRTRDGVRPLYVSTGHRVSLPTARKLVLACAPRYRLPETTRWADRIAGGFEPG